MKNKVCGVGFNSQGGRIARLGNGKISKSYNCWRNMIKRCYDPYVINKNPTYKDCYVCEEWHDYQCFADWFDERYPKDGGDYYLDKDLKVIGNKVYSPKRCLLVSRVVNNFTTASNSARGDYPIGVYLQRDCNRLKAQCKNPFTGIRGYIGLFDSPLEAHMAWRNKKYEYAIILANQQEREEVRVALLNWAQALKEFRIHPIDS